MIIIIPTVKCSSASVTGVFRSIRATITVTNSVGSIQGIRRSR